jgi:hypothetical protein
MFTQCISNSQCIRADSARVDWSKAVQVSSVQVPKNWGLFRSRSKNFLDWTWTRLDGSSPDWSIAGLVESVTHLLSDRATEYSLATAHRGRSRDSLPIRAGIGRSLQQFTDVDLNTYQLSEETIEDSFANRP